jgi:hypothetical protein
MPRTIIALTLLAAPSLAAADTILGAATETWPLTGSGGAPAAGYELQDVTSDGLPDLVWFDGSPRMRPNLGDRSFGAEEMIGSTQQQLVDLDADGDLDLFIAADFDFGQPNRAELRWRERDDVTGELLPESVLPLPDATLFGERPIAGVTFDFSDVGQDGVTDLIRTTRFWDSPSFPEVTESIIEYLTPDPVSGNYSAQELTSFFIFDAVAFELGPDFDADGEPSVMITEFSSTGSIEKQYMVVSDGSVGASLFSSLLSTPFQADTGNLFFLPPAGDDLTTVIAVVQPFFDFSSLVTYPSGVVAAAGSVTTVGPGVSGVETLSSLPIELQVPDISYEQPVRIDAGQGTFGSEEHTVLSLALDVDEDGDQDLVLRALYDTQTANERSAYVVFRNEGDRLAGSLTEPVRNAAPSSGEFGVTFAGQPVDLDGDGDAEFAEFDAGSGAVIVTEIREVHVADFDVSGDVGASDLATLIGGWGSSGETDLTSDGFTDAKDLAMLIGAWGN